MGFGFSRLRLNTAHLLGFIVRTPVSHAPVASVVTRHNTVSLAARFLPGNHFLIFDKWLRITGCGMKISLPNDM